MKFFELICGKPYPILVSIHAHKITNMYWIIHLRSDAHGHGFRVRPYRSKHSYDVFVGEHSSCDCADAGWRQWRLCKHIRAIHGLIADGVIP